MIDFGIIAAGDGNRIKEEGFPIPKPLVDIDGQPMIGRLIKLMEKAGASSVSIIVNSDMPEVLHYLQNLVPSRDCQLRIASRKTPSSMHTFYELTKLIQPSDKFIITTVDTIFRAENFESYVSEYMNSPKDIDGLMGVTKYIDDEKPLYVNTDVKDRITAYLDEKVEGIKYVSAGVYGLDRNALTVLEQCINSGINRMRNFQRKLVEAGLNLKAFDLGKVLDVDHIGDIEKANAFLK